MRILFTPEASLVFCFHEWRQLASMPRHGVLQCLTIQTSLYNGLYTEETEKPLPNLIETKGN
eukprot:m.3742 g.3742  ORF g.3742 m.3742 type:complete len:62 (+) comp9745_c0_seq2:1482-1667(+)